MNKLYFKNPQELVDFMTEVATNLNYITINNITFYVKNCKINVDNAPYIDIFDNNNNLICCMRNNGIENVNEYKIFTAWH